MLKELLPCPFGLVFFQEPLQGIESVRVIYLRGTATNGESHELTGNHYHHRWIVSGHWRSQPYGPGRQHRKPVWIMPHIKGPEGAPMLDGEKVTAVVR